MRTPITKIAPGSRPAFGHLIIDKAVVDQAFNPQEIVCSELRLLLKQNPEMLQEASSLTITIEVGVPKL